MKNKNREATAIFRLKKFINYAKAKGDVRSIRDFENICGLSPSYINNSYTNGKGSIGSDKLACIAIKFPMLNIRWLCTGEGDMTIDDNDYSQEYRRALKIISELERIVRRIADGSEENK